MNPILTPIIQSFRRRPEVITNGPSHRHREQSAAIQKARLALAERFLDCRVSLRPPRRDRHGSSSRPKWRDLVAQRADLSIAQRSNRDDQRGFTLIELSIVIVIIGLIIGGVLVGRDMIEVAQARKMMSQIEQLQLATTTFKLKYNCLAGDCKNAASFGLGLSGNGDSLIGSTTDPDHCIRANVVHVCEPLEGVSALHQLLLLLAVAGGRLNDFSPI